MILLASGRARGGRDPIVAPHPVDAGDGGAGALLARVVGTMVRIARYEGPPFPRPGRGPAPRAFRLPPGVRQDPALLRVLRARRGGVRAHVGARALRDAQRARCARPGCARGRRPASRGGADPGAHGEMTPDSPVFAAEWGSV